MAKAGEVTVTVKLDKTQIKEILGAMECMHERIKVDDEPKGALH